MKIRMAKSSTNVETITQRTFCFSPNILGGVAKVPVMTLSTVFARNMVIEQNNAKERKLLFIFIEENHFNFFLNKGKQLSIFCEECGGSHSPKNAVISLLWAKL